MLKKKSNEAAGSSATANGLQAAQVTSWGKPGRVIKGVTAVAIKK